MTQPSEPPKEVVTAEALAFQQWRQDPQTLVFFRYLADLLAEVQDQWLKRKFETELTNAEALGTAATLDELTKLSYSDMEKFYVEQRDQYERYASERPEVAGSPRGSRGSY